MDIKIQNALGLLHVDEERKKGIYHLMSILPDDASYDEILAVYETIPTTYKEKLKLTQEEIDLKDSEDEEDSNSDEYPEDDFEQAYNVKALATINFLLQKEKDLLLTTKSKNKSLLSKAVQAITKEAHKLLKWEQKEATLEAFKTSLSDLYNIENPEDYFTKKNALVSEYILLVKKQVDDKVPAWKNILSNHRITVQKILNNSSTSDDLTDGESSTD